MGRASSKSEVSRCGEFVTDMELSMQAARLERAIAASQRVQLESLRRQLEVRPSCFMKAECTHAISLVWLLHMYAHAQSASDL